MLLSLKEPVAATNLLSIIRLKPKLPVTYWSILDTVIVQFALSILYTDVEAAESVMLPSPTKLFNFRKLCLPCLQ